MSSRRYYLTLLFALFGIIRTFPAFAQSDCYVQLDDASGFDISPYQDELDSAACELAAAFQDTAFSNHFKVFGFGFYLNLDYYESYSYPQVFLDVEQEVAEMSPYYLLIGRQSDRSGIFTKFWVDVKLPETGSFNTDCLDETARILLTSSIGVDVNQKHNQLEKDPTRYYEAELLGMDSLIAFIEKVIDCCDPETRTSCDLCSNSSTIMDYFLELGFDKYQYKIIGSSAGPLPGGQNKVEDFAGLQVEIDGDTLNLAEVLLEMFNSPVFDPDSIEVKGLFTKDINCCNTDFLNAKNIWDNSNFDFIQWLHYSQIYTPEGNNYVFVKIKENLSEHFKSTDLPPIAMYFVPNPEINEMFDLDSVEYVITNIFKKNGIENIDFYLFDKYQLDVHDLWLTLIESYSHFYYGNTKVEYIYPLSIKWQSSNNNGCWVNFGKIKFQNDNKNESFFNYRIGYVASHEYLHQLLIKAYWYIFTADGSQCNWYCNYFYQYPHDSSEDNLNCDGNELRNPLLKKWTKLFPDAEKILLYQRNLIVSYSLLRKFDVGFSAAVRKVFFPKIAKSLKEKFLNEFE